MWLATILVKPKKKQAPKFTKKLPDSSDMNEGDGVVLEVVVTGEPEPEVVWMKSDQPITVDSTDYVIEKDGNIHRLTIAHVKPSMAALYNARAENTAGQTSSRSRLKVKREY